MGSNTAPSYAELMELYELYQIVKVYIEEEHHEEI